MEIKTMVKRTQRERVLESANNLLRQNTHHHKTIAKDSKRREKKTQAELDRIKSHWLYKLFKW
jgi:hypothetical protein